MKDRKGNQVLKTFFLIFALTTTLALSFQSARANENKLTLFGVTARWETNSTKSDRAMQQALEQIAKDGKEYFDPDCRWRQPDPEGNCPNSFMTETKELEKLSDLFHKETLGYFDIRHSASNTKDKKGIVRRDFGAIWQGYVLEKLKGTIAKEWILDISGDIFVTDSKFIKRPLIITDPIFDAVDYANVTLKHGFMITSVSRQLGSLVRVPEALKKQQTQAETEQILKVVLFGAPEFSGARLDAWSTAIAAGGTKVLNHLGTLKKFSGHWGYLYFGLEGTPHCSDNLRCELEGDEKRVTAPF